MSSSVARITGPGTVPLYVQAGKKTPGAISISRSNARIAYSRTRPGWYGSARRRVQEVVEVVGAADGGRLTADHRRVPHLRVAVHVALQRALRRLRVAVERQLAEHGRATSGAAPARRRRRVNLAMPKH